MATQVETDLVLTPLETQDKWERLIHYAIDKGSGADQIAKLYEVMAMARREDARLAYLASMAEFKRNIPEILKTKKVTIATRDGNSMAYSHPELDKASLLVGESLAAVGITHAWRPSEGANGRIIMTCVFTHNASGHTEDVATLGGPPDTSGGKNNVQAIGSTSSYLQRYTLLAGAGIVPKGMDNDGATPTEGMSEDAITDYCIQMRDSAHFEELKGVFGECYTKAKALQDKEAQSRLIKVYEEKKRELRNG